MLVADVVWLGRGLGAAAHRLLKRAVRIVNLEHDVAHTVAVQANVVCRRVIRRERRREEEPRAALLERVRRLGAAPRFKPAVRHL